MLEILTISATEEELQTQADAYYDENYAGHYVYISDEMIGHKLGEFVPTRTFKGHAGDKTSKVK